MFFGLLSVCAIGCCCVSLASNYKEPMKCVSLKNQPCKSRRSIVNINSDKTLFYPLTVGVNKCGGNCKTVVNPYPRVFVPSKVKNILKLFYIKII